VQHLIGDAQRLKKYKQSFDTNPNLRIRAAKIKFQQMNEIYAEILRLKLGLSKHTCYLRNYLHVLSGEMELYCNIDITRDVNNILLKIDGGISEENWEQIVSECLKIYEMIYDFCN